MPLAPPVIKIVLLVSFIIKYPPNHVTIYKVARKLSIDRQNNFCYQSMEPDECPCIRFREERD